MTDSMPIKEFVETIFREAREQLDRSLVEKGMPPSGWTMFVSDLVRYDEMARALKCVYKVKRVAIPAGLGLEPAFAFNEADLDLAKYFRINGYKGVLPVLPTPATGEQG